MGLFSYDMHDTNFVSAIEKLARAAWLAANAYAIQVKHETGEDANDGIRA